MTEKINKGKVLQEEMSRAQLYLDIAGVMLCVLDTEGRVMLINSKGCEILGYKVKDIIGKNWFDHFLPERLIKEVKGVFFSLMAGDIKSVEYYENSILRKNGVERVVAFHNTVIRDQGNNITGVLFSGEDITERKAVEYKLFISEQKYRKFIESANDAIFIADAETGIILEANKKASELLGIPIKKIIGMHQSELHPKEESEKYSKIFRKHVQKGHAVTETLYVVNKSGGKIPVEISANVINLGDQKIIQGSFRDITERMKFEDTLRQSQERMKLALEGTDQGLWDWNVSTGEITFDDNWHKVLGYVHGEIHFDFAWWEKNVHPDSKPVFEKALNSYLSGQSKYYELEYQLKKKSGDWMWIWARGICTEFDKNKKPLRMIGTHRDITEHKKANIALEASERKYRDIFDNANDGICVVDSSGKIVISNPECAKMFGYQLDETLGKYSGDLVHPDDRQRVMNIQKKRFSGEKVPSVYEFLGVKKNGESINIEINTNLIITEGKLVGTRAILRDITESKLIEEKLKASEKELKIHARELEESNVALKVLLKQREDDKREFEENILSNIKHLIIPYLEKLKLNRSMSDELSYLNIIESNLNDIISPFSSRMSSKYLGFTPKETQIANLIKDGRQDKEIAEILNISPVTVKSHRQNIRKKLDIYGKKTNLRSFLLSIK